MPPLTGEDPPSARSGIRRRAATARKQPPGSLSGRASLEPTRVGPSERFQAGKPEGENARHLGLPHQAEDGNATPGSAVDHHFEAPGGRLGQLEGAPAGVLEAPGAIDETRIQGLVARVDPAFG